MKTLFKMRPAAVAIGVILATSAAVYNGQVLNDDGFSSWIPSAVAAQGQGGQKGRMGGQGQGGGGQGMQGGGAGQGQRGGGKSVEALVSDEGDDDSDKPEWAQGNKEANPHRGDPNPTPGDMKGDEFGDLYVVVRDAVTGVPILVAGEDGIVDELQICQDPACTPELVVATVDGEVPATAAPVEVDFGRLNIGRAPTKVIDHALDEALSKITADSVLLALDPAGRITVDGVTIDSPLENLALYIGVMTSDPAVLAALDSLPGDPLVLAPALLGAAADKTGELSVDLVYYSNQIYDIVQGAQVYDYVDFLYDRSIYDQEVTYNYYTDDGAILTSSINLKAYLDATQPTLDGALGISLFSIAADDALEIVEFVHTQIQESEITLP